MGSINKIILKNLMPVMTRIGLNGEGQKGDS